MYELSLMLLMLLTVSVSAVSHDFPILNACCLLCNGNLLKYTSSRCQQRMRSNSFIRKEARVIGLYALGSVRSFFPGFIRNEIIPFLHSRGV